MARVKNITFLGSTTSTNEIPTKRGGAGVHIQIMVWS